MIRTVQASSDSLAFQFVVRFKKECRTGQLFVHCVTYIPICNEVHGW